MLGMNERRLCWGLQYPVTRLDAEKFMQMGTIAPISKLIVWGETIGKNRIGSITAAQLSTRLHYSCCSLGHVNSPQMETIQRSFAALRRTRGNSWSGVRVEKLSVKSSLGGVTKPEMLGLVQPKLSDTWSRGVQKLSEGRNLGGVTNTEKLGLVQAKLSDARPEGGSSIAVLMEVEGVLADVPQHGHRQGFNIAFQELGLDCAQWTEAVYADLMRAAGGVEEKMLSSFFTRIGWPSTLPTNEEEAFTHKVLQVKSLALETLAGSHSIPLRPGLEKFVDEVLEAKVPLVILGADYQGGEHVARLLVDKLGRERSEKVRFVRALDLENSSHGQLVSSEGASGVEAEKQRKAEEVLKLSSEIDTSLSQVSTRTIAALRAGAKIANMDVDQCILLASGLSGSQAAYQIGMPCVVVRSSFTPIAEFPAAKAILDGYGPESTTLHHLLQFL